MTIEYKEGDMTIISPNADALLQVLAFIKKDTVSITQSPTTQESVGRSRYHTFTSHDGSSLPFPDANVSDAEVEYILRDGNYDIEKACDLDWLYHKDSTADFDILFWRYVYA